MSKKKTLSDFEALHGHQKIQRLQKELATEKEKVAALADVQNTIHVEDSKKDTIKFGIIGDTHFGSLYEGTAQLKAFYEYAASRGVKDFYHAGDVIDGHKIYKGQEFEVRDVGLEAQIERFAQNAPKIGTTYFITGNHDSSFKNLVGVSVGKMLQSARKDWVFLGEDQATIQFNVPSKKKYSLMLLHPGGGSSYALCFDNMTEIMTEKRGWQLFKDLLPEDRVGTLNPKTEVFEWQQPTAYTDELYKGDMYHFKARSFDLMVTPNHRMFVRKYDKALEYQRLDAKDLKYPTKSHRTISSDWQFVEAKNLANARRQEWQMTKCVKGWVGETPEFIEIPHREPKKWASSDIKHFGKMAVEDAAELIAWYVTEGCIHRSGKQLNICQSQRVNPGYHAQIVDLFRRIGFDNVKPRGKDNKDIVVCSVELCDWLLAECGRGSANKFLPDWLKNCDTSVLQIVMDTMIAGDGWDNGPSFGYKSISKRLRHDISEVAVKLGYGVTEHADCVSISTQQKYPTINNAPEVEQYTGRIFCVTVPNSVVLVRRNGRAVFSGNSYRAQKIAESISPDAKTNMLAIGHYHKSHFMPNYRNISVLQTGTFCRQTPFMQRQGLAAHVGGWVVEVVVGPMHNVVRPEFVAFY